MEPEQQTKQSEPDYNKGAYLWAWVAFAASVISLIVATFKDVKPPKKSDYEK